MMCPLATSPPPSSTRCATTRSLWPAIWRAVWIPYRFELFEGVIHAFLHYTKMLDAANDALEHGAAFYRETMASPNYRQSGGA